MQFSVHSLLALAVLAAVSLSVVEATYYCHQPQALQHGGHNGSSSYWYDFGCVIKYWCDEGYTLQGNNQRTCSYSSSRAYYWSGNHPSCISNHPPNGDDDTDDDDGDSSDSSNGGGDSSDSSYGGGDSSDSSYGGGDSSDSSYGGGDSSDSSSNGDDSSSSSSGGDSSSSSGIGDIYSDYPYCPHLSSIENGYAKYVGRYTGAIAKYCCKRGYTLEGNVYRKCLPSGEWSGTEPKCKGSGCERLISPRHGVVIYSSTEVGSYAKYFCKEGYYLVGVRFRKCEETGWTDEAPICKPILCDPLPKLKCGSFKLSKGYRLNSVATYCCYHGYGFKEGHGDIKRVCQEDGSWSGSPPLCISKECPYLDHPDNGQVKVTEGRHVGAEVWYICNTGYRLVGTEYRTCGSNLTWSGEAPQCVAQTGCDRPERPEHGWTRYRYTTAGSQALYYCYRGYVRVGTDMRTCNSTGEWEPELPVCKPKTGW